MCCLSQMPERHQGQCKGAHEMVGPYASCMLLSISEAVGAKAGQSFPIPSTPLAHAHETDVPSLQQCLLGPGYTSVRYALRLRRAPYVHLCALVGAHAWLSGATRGGWRDRSGSIL